jgi:hypothetical protein
MLKQVHDHIIGELNQGARTDTIFVVTAVLFNLMCWASIRPWRAKRHPRAQAPQMT